MKAPPDGFAGQCPASLNTNQHAVVYYANKTVCRLCGREYDSRGQLVSEGEAFGATADQPPTWTSKELDFQPLTPGDKFLQGLRLFGFGFGVIMILVGCVIGLFTRVEAPRVMSDQSSVHITMVCGAPWFGQPNGVSSGSYTDPASFGHHYRDPNKVYDNQDLYVPADAAEKAEKEALQRARCETARDAAAETPRTAIAIGFGAISAAFLTNPFRPRRRNAARPK